MQVQKVKISEIIIGERFREDYGNVEELALSITSLGLIQPIVISKNKELIAGGRRLQAHILLNYDEIDAVFYEDADPLTQKMVELEENIKRKEFTWQEELKAKSDLHTLKQQVSGKAKQGYGGGWGLAQTSAELRESVGALSQDLKLADAMNKNPDLAKCKNKTEAWRKLQNMQETEVKKELAQRVKIEISSNCIKHGRSELILKDLKAETIDCIVTDPPWGIEIENSQQGKDWDQVHTGASFDDSKHNTMNLLNLVFKECFRVLKPNTHMYVFFGIQFYAEVKNLLMDAGFSVNDSPLIWNKTSGGQAGTDYQYTHAYECIFFCMKGKRAVNKLGMPNVLTFDRVPPNQKIHPTEKPRQLLIRLIEQATIPGEVVCDPFAGSGSTILAALECNRQGIGVELNDKHYNSAFLAVQEYKQACEKASEVKPC